MTLFQLLRLPGWSEGQPEVADLDGKVGKYKPIIQGIATIDGLYHRFETISDEPSRNEIFLLTDN